MTKGSKVHYVGASDEQVRWGNCSDPRRLLLKDKTYVVENVEVHSWHTKVSLVGITGQFNSTCLREQETDK